MSESNLASDFIHKHLTLFGKGIIETQHPSHIDGLKSVHRRILMSVRKKLSERIKSPKLVGEVMDIHPHGDTSIYNAMVRMGQGFEYNPPLLDFRSESAGGTYTEPRAGANRYTRLRVPEFTYDVFFKGIEYTALPKKRDETEMGYEPIYFVPSIPTALLYANNSIGYAYSSYTAPHNLSDVCDLVIAYVEYKKSKSFEPFNYVKYVEKFLPDFPVYGTLTNSEELLEAYRQGDFNRKIKIDGEVRLTEDTIQIKTLPYGVPFEPLKKDIDELMFGKDSKGSWYDLNFVGVKSLSSGYDRGNVVVKVKRGVNIFEAWDLLKKKIQFSGTLTPIPHYNDEGYAIQISPPNLLAMWYDVRYNILVSSKKIKIADLTSNLRKIEALLIICDHVDECVEILRSNKKKESIVILQNRYNLTYFQAEYLSEAKFNTLSVDSKAELQERKISLDNQLLEIQESFSRIPDEIAKEALYIKKKYSTPRRTKIPKYLGYVKIGGGCIQYESSEEIAQIIEDFPKEKMEIHSYDGPHLYKVSDGNKLEKGSIPKITTGDIYGLKTNQIMTVNISDGTACCVKGFVPGLRSEGYFYTTPKSHAIYRNGDIKLIDVESEISLRKTICRGANTNIIYVYPDIKQEHYVIALNTTSPNVVTIQKVVPNSSRIALGPIGDIMIIHSIDKHVFLNIPQAYLNRSAVRVVELIDVEKILEGKDQIRLDIASAKVKSNKLIRLL